jgi:hypothetical protein
MSTRKKIPGLQSVSELHRPSDRRLSAKLVPTLADRGCRMVSAKNSHGRLLRFSRPEPLLSFLVAPQLSWRGWVDPVPDPLFLRKSYSAGNRTRDLWICSQKLWPLDYRGGPMSTRSRCKLTAFFFSGFWPVWSDKLLHYRHEALVHCCNLLGCDGNESVTSSSIFGWNVLSPCLGSKDNPSKQASREQYIPSKRP